MQYNEDETVFSKGWIPFFGGLLLVLFLAVVSFAYLSNEANSTRGSVIAEVNATLAASGSSVQISSGTSTPRPTLPATRAAPPTPWRPFTLSGIGDDVVDVHKRPSAAIAHITYTGPRNFSIISYDTDGSRIALLVNVIGNYDGVVPLDFGDTHTGRLEITASGPWEIAVSDAIEAPRVTAPGTHRGQGDAVLILTGDRAPDTLEVDATATEGHFAIEAYGNSRALLVNEIAPYEGTVLIPSRTIAQSPAWGNAVFIIVSAEGPWSFTAEVR